MKRRSTLLAVLALAAGLSTAFAQDNGLLGERYAGIAYGYADADDVNGHGAAVHLNLPMHLAADGWGIDLGLEGTYISGDEGAFGGDATGAMAEGRLFSKQFGEAGLYSATYRFFAELNVGRSKLEGLGFSASSWALGGGAGVEFQLGGSFTLTPYYRYIEYEKYSSGADTVGVDASVWLNERDNLFLNVARMSAAGADVDTYQFGYRRAF